MPLSSKISLEQLAAELGCSRSLMRFWEEEFNLQIRSNNPLSDLNIAEIKLIYHLIEVQGLPLSDAKDQFAISRQRLITQYDSIENLTRLRKALVGLKTRLDERSSFL
jgi:DNA-binding transcriptional MerR regulator